MTVPYTCPNCGDTEHLLVECTVEALLVQDAKTQNFECDIDTFGTDWDFGGNSDVRCRSCGWDGKLIAAKTQ